MAALPEPPLPPMEAESVDEIPKGDWQYEPKWDGFRCLVFKDGNSVKLQSKSGQPLERYFPELVETLRAVKSPRFTLDGEIVVETGAGPDFDALLQRIHPAESRVRRLAKETPASLWVFDLLSERSRSLLAKPLETRRAALERFAKKLLREPLRLTPASRELADARKWLAGKEGCDGVMAKKLGEPYRGGERSGMVKIKRARTADCVVGGFRYASSGKGLGSLLLGLYDDSGLLHHVGFCSNMPREKKGELLKMVEALKGPPGFTGRAPGGPSRWSTERSTEWVSLRHALVVEVGFDHVTGGRFRHGTSFKRLRPEKTPRQCMLDQLGR